MDVEPFDFRRPSKFSREHMRGLEAVHEVFARQVGSSLSHRLRSVVTITHFSTDQITYGDYLRSIPTPSVISTIDMAPLPGVCVVEITTPIAFAFVDRVLGGSGGKVPTRGPTDIEAALITELMSSVVEGFVEALEPIEEVTPELRAVEFNPRFVQVVPPNDMVLLLSYSIALDGGAEGIISVCYPFGTIEPVLGRLESKVRIQGKRVDADAVGPFHELLPEVEVPVVFQLTPSQIPARELVGLAPGDIVRTNHRIDQAIVGHVGDRRVLEARLGRKARRMAVQITGWSN
ncbi:MAG: flagellar motor switch protein FliM [Actinobacteria bacterium]|nr:flagellar motor switch protein FliM [Actinomycetota bacterium]